jgi:two-component system, chemotaxis family, chemotaxis protein CheY
MQALVIDDSRAMRSMIGKIMRQLGFDVVEAADGKEALGRLHEGVRPGIALVDWNMPEMNGLDFVKSVRLDASFADLPLMMVTTENEMSQVVVALSAGANEYLMKPFTKEMLIEKLDILGIEHR